MEDTNLKIYKEKGNLVKEYFDYENGYLTSRITFLKHDVIVYEKFNCDGDLVTRTKYKMFEGIKKGLQLWCPYSIDKPLLQFYF